ncbi:MAG: aminodeoxychorismate/anthranilate synthase component II [Acidobacteriia bacterium]|nr:aminodeoxychorismate/anthranilate synthase component II [Terriglobia bacterium]
MILVIDNYDSFTFNLVQYLGELGQELKVARNDAVTPAQIELLAPAAIVISPGPGRPENSGIIVEVIRRFCGRIPILGVCLGLQALGVAFGGKVVPAPTLMHGKTSEIFHDGRTIFTGLANPFHATRYHSLIVANECLPGCLEISARTADDVIMGLRHRVSAVEGVQFHPESILTEEGMKLLGNFLSLAQLRGAADPGRLKTHESGDQP